jgi:uncharacterized protein (DUF1697 family)
MKRFAAFLRGVSPGNCRMPELAQCFAAAGFTDVKTVLSSGNVVFTASGTESAIRQKAEDAIKSHLDKTFMVFVRPVEAVQAMLASDPYAAFELKPGAKRVVTLLLAEPLSAPALPIEHDGATLVRLEDSALFSAYVPSLKGPVFMRLIERHFGKDVTTRTWDTLRKVCAASESLLNASRVANEATATARHG